MRTSWSQTVLGLLLVAGMSGCSNSDNQRVYPVRGTVQLEGKDMPGGGSIAFIPMERQPGKAAGGEIRENGTYELTTYSSGDGSMVGNFRVVIVQVSSIEPREAPPDGQPMPAGGMQGIQLAAEDLIPAAYSDPNTSPLRATVEANSNVINFDLQRKLEVPVNGANPPGTATRSRNTRRTFLAMLPIVAWIFP